MGKIVSSGGLERSLQQCSDPQRKYLFRRTLAIQPTQGCSIGCSDCGAGAEKGVSDYIYFNTMERIVPEIAEISDNRDFVYYFASEPSDYFFDGKDIFDIDALVKKHFSSVGGTITAIAKGREEYIFNKLLSQQSNFGFFDRPIQRISLTDFNYRRLESAFEKMNPVRCQIKHSLMYHTNFEDTTVKSFGRLTFPKFLNYLGRNGLEVMNFYSTKIKRLKLGQKNIDNLGHERMLNREGFVLTPKGIFDVKLTRITPEFPTGLDIAPIDLERLPV